MKNLSKFGFLSLAAGAFMMHACKKTNNENATVKSIVNKKSDSVVDVISPRGPKVQSFDNHLIAYYPLNGNAIDATGNGHDGVVHGATATTDQFGNGNGAMHFTGSISSFIRVPDAPNLRLNSTAFTINAWVRLDSYNSGQGSGILMKRSALMSSWGYSITGSSYTASSGATGAGHVYFGSGGAGVYGISTHVAAPGASDWHMVTAVYNNNSSADSIKIYLDGSLDGSAQSFFYASPTDTAAMFIGKDNFLNSYVFSGDMDEIRIYNIALNSIQISSLYDANNDASLVAYWPLGGSLEDFTGNGHNGTAGGSITYTTGHLNNPNAAAHFDGSTNYISVPDAAGLRISGNFTINAWIKPQSLLLPTNQIMSKFTSPSAGWSWDVNSSGDVDFNTNGNINSVFAGISTGTWHMITVTYDKLHSVDSVFVDGYIAGTITGATINSSTCTATLFIGKDNSGGGLFKGDMDDIKIFNRRLYSPQVLELYNRRY